jgi:hypothetical protein
VARDAAAGRPQTVIQNNSITQNNINTTVVVQRLETEAAELRGMADLFKIILREQMGQNTGTGTCQGVATQTAVVLNSRIREIQSKFTERTTELSRYVASVKPNDPDLRITARRASELFPKVAYTIQGTPEQGEFWLEPNVSDSGELSFNLKFIDVAPGGVERVRGTIPLTSQELATLREALCKLHSWSATAHERAVTEVTKRVVCFPEARCPAEGAKREGMASTELIFNVDSDGRTRGRIQRNRGRVADSYDISIESAMMLQAYLNHILLEGTREFDARSRTMEEKRNLFQ